MKEQRKSTKTVSKNLFQFFERKNAKTKFESPYSEQLQKAIKGTNHIVTTSDNRPFYRKLVSKPIKLFEQETSNKSTGRRVRDETFVRKEDKVPVALEQSPLLENQTDTSPELPAAEKSGTIGREGQDSSDTGNSQPHQERDPEGPKIDSLDN